MAGPEINNIKNELQQAVEQRQIFIEYDVLAKQINKFPTCSEARIEIETLQKDLDFVSGSVFYSINQIYLFCEQFRLRCYG